MHDNQGLARTNSCRRHLPHLVQFAQQPELRHRAAAPVARPNGSVGHFACTRRLPGRL